MSDANHTAIQIVEHLRDTGHLHGIADEIGAGIARKVGPTLSRRDAIAAQALVAIVAHRYFAPIGEAAREAVEYADALIAALDGSDPLGMLASLVPYAETRAEDMDEAVSDLVEANEGAGAVRMAAEARDEASKAVEDAKAVLRAAGRLP